MPTFQREVAIGDGNCAFNAFILGLCQEETLYCIEQVMHRELKNIDEALSVFINAASSVLKIEPGNFAVLKTKLIDLRQNDPRGLQKALAPLMREMACNLLLDDASKKAALEESFLGAYDSYTNPSKKVVRDDVYFRHPFIQTKFQERLTVEELRTWWSSCGYTKFIGEMKKDRVHAGDIELAPLAEYFRINLQVTRGDFTHGIYRDYGELPKTLLQDEVLRFELCNRGIVDNPSNEQELVPLNLDSDALQRRLEKVPNFEEISSFINDQTNDDLDFKSFPSTWPEEALSELQNRGVISRSRGMFSLKKSAAILRISALDSRLVESILRHSKKELLPTVALINANASHWDFMREVKTFQAFKNDLLIPLKRGDFQHFPNKWEKWVNEEIEKHGKQKGQVAILSENNADDVTYTVSSAIEIKVSKEQQIKLDEEYAKKLQQEEYDALLNHHSGPRK